MEGDPFFIVFIDADFLISIHTLRVEGDLLQFVSNLDNYHFNPHPPCGGWQIHLFRFVAVFLFQSTPSVWRVTNLACNFLWQHRFQSTPSVWRVTCVFPINQTAQKISIHTLRVEGDNIFLVYMIEHISFQSTPSVWRVTHNILCD